MIKMKNAMLVPLLLASCLSHGYGPYDAKDLRVIDGDTIKLTVELWPGLSQRISVRLSGVNTAETRRTKLKCEKVAGLAAKKYVQDLIVGADITVDDIRIGKFAGRVLGDIKIDGVSLTDELIRTGHGRFYDGGKRGDWCIDKLTGEIK